MSTKEVPSSEDPKLIQHLIQDLFDPDLKDYTLSELRKKREMFEDIAPLLWYSFGTIALLLQEIIKIYPALSPPNLTPAESNRVCNVLALFQSIASHPMTRTPFLNAQIPQYLYPLLNTKSQDMPFEFLRLTTLGVIGALVKTDDPEVIKFLLQSEVVPLCLRCMEIGSELSRTVACFVLLKILQDDDGLKYVCASAERFFATASVLANMLHSLAAGKPSVRLLRSIIRCYLRLSDKERAHEALQTCLPDVLKDGTFDCTIKDDNQLVALLQQLLDRISAEYTGPGPNQCPEIQFNPTDADHPSE